MEVFIRDEDKEKYESFSLMGYYYTNRKGEENTDLKECLIQDIWVSDDDENLPRLTVKSLDHHDAEVRKQEREKVIAELEEFEKEHRLRARKTSEEYQTDNEEQKARLYALSNGRFDILESIKQKLEEMKGEKDERK